jgi:glycosyltransferase involved in cell wall biosynthesis
MRLSRAQGRSSNLEVLTEECKIWIMSSTEANSKEPSTQAENVPVRGGQRLKGIIPKGGVDQPLVTVITAIYNGKPYIAGCLESVLRQDYPTIEHIVVDGGSNDGTVDVLRQYDDRIALWRSEPDHGVYDAWNKALLESNGEWICFLGVDDEFLPGAVSAYMTLASESPQADYLCSRVKWVHSSGFERLIGSPWTWRKFSKSMCTAHVGSMHRRSLFERLGTYDTSYRMVADYELLLRARDQLKTAFMPTTTALMRAGGVSGNRTALDEQARAKLAAGGRSNVQVAVELYFAYAKFALRPLRYMLGRLRAR